jgi:hypothetical protein
MPEQYGRDVRKQTGRRVWEPCGPSEAVKIDGEFNGFEFDAAPAIEAADACSWYK